MAGFTNRGKKLILGKVFNLAAIGVDTNFYIALATPAITPTADTNILSDLTAVTGTGYAAGGLVLARNSTDFPTLTEDDSGDLGSIQIKSVNWTAGASDWSAIGWAVLLDDNATPANRQVLAFWNLGSTTPLSGNTISLSGCELRLTE